GVMDGNLESVAQEEIVKVGPKFMPSLTDAVASASVDEATKVFAGSLRILVCSGFTVNKENPEFPPGDVEGICRVYPHVMVMASGPLLSVEGDVVVHRPAKPPHAGDMDNNRYFDSGGLPDPLLPIDTMGPELTHELIADANHGRLGAPFWSNIFDYY